ncbi:hypothetical protein EH228_10750 [Erwinia endophytica]|nr:hypothetical protein EH228_10750 [Erwinia endophytica]
MISALRLFIFSIELRRNLAESRPRKKATGHPVAFFAPSAEGLTLVSILFSTQHPSLPLPFSPSWTHPFHSGALSTTHSIPALHHPDATLSFLSWNEPSWF